MCKKNNILVIAFAAIIVLIAQACANANGNTGGTDTVIDDYGRSVVVPKNPQRVVSISPAVTEILYDLGAESILVGRTDFCKYPAEVEHVPSVGGISNLNVERIMSMEPDLIISGSMVGKKYTDQFDQMGIPLVCVIEKSSFDMVFSNIERIGSLVGREKEADSLNVLLRYRLDEIIRPDEENPHSCYYVVGYGAGGNFTAGGNTFINDIIRMAGGRNIAAGIEGWSYSLEALMKEDPEYIIVRREDSVSFVNMKPYDRLSAVRNGRVIGIESGMLDLQVPRNIDAVLYLRKRMENK